MITSVLKFSEVKVDPTCLIGWDRPAAITRYGDVVAYVMTPKRMDELLKAEEMLNRIKSEHDQSYKDLPF